MNRSALIVGLFSIGALVLGSLRPTTIPVQLNNGSSVGTGGNAS